MVIAPQPPTEWKRTVMLLSGIRFGFSEPRTASSLTFGIAVFDGLLVHLLLGRDRLGTDKVDREIELLLAGFPSGSMFSIAPMMPSGCRSRLPMPNEPE